MRIHISIYVYTYICVYIYMYIYMYLSASPLEARGGGLGSRPKKMYGERLGDGVEYHLMKTTPRR